MKLIIFLILLLSWIHALANEITSAGGLQLSRASLDLIIHYETGGRVYYERKLSRATWPGGASGVTVGCGYDCGYNTVADIARDWGHLPAATVRQLQSVAGLKGQAAKIALPRASGLVISWAQALAVFEAQTLPRFSALTARTFRDLNAQNPHGQGALIGLIFNRGASLVGGNRVEMAAIARLVPAARMAEVPAQIRRMKRLWFGRGLDGLLRRREAEAALVERGLREG